MTRRSLTTTFICALSICAASNLAIGAEEIFGTRHEVSPDGLYALALSNAINSQMDRQLTILRGKKVLHSYLFKSSLSSHFWGPKNRYLAINNHYGHRGWNLWVVRLSDGKVLRANDRESSSIGDSLQYHASIPDVVTPARPMLEKLYPGYAADGNRRGGGHITVAYGWKDADTLMLYDEVVLDDLFEKEKCRLSIYSLLHITKDGLHAEVISVEKTGYDGTNDRRPKEVRSVLGY